LKRDDEGIEKRGALETAHRALGNCGQVFRYAILPPAAPLHFGPQGTTFCGFEQMRRALPIKRYFRAV
jgi:hypothetical protein